MTSSAAHDEPFTASARFVASLRLAVLLTAQAAAVAVLHRLGDVPWLALPRTAWGAWVAAGPVVDVVAGVARVVALALAWWLFASTALYSAGRFAGAARLARVAGALAPGAVRRVADRAVAATVAVALWGGPTAAIAAPAPVVAATQALPAPPGWPGVPAPAPAPVPVRPPEVAPPPPAPEPARSSAAQPGAEVPPASGQVHAVVQGESLWSIAADVVEARSGSPDDRAVATYWVRVVDAAAPVLRSGDPDVIHPGEQVPLPP